MKNLYQLEKKEFLKDKNNISDGLERKNNVSQEDYKEILRMHTDEGMSAIEIFVMLEESGYDLYGLNEIEEIINDYEREKRLRGKQLPLIFQNYLI